MNRITSNYKNCEIYYLENDKQWRYSHNNKVVEIKDEIDELILPIIEILNDKGYETLYCCSGHIGTSTSNCCYIVFKAECLPNTLPKGFVLEDDEYYKNNYKPFDTPKGQITIRKWYGVNSYMERLKRIYEAMRDLYIWADNLESTVVELIKYDFDKYKPKEVE